jgi:hypothetical protein
MPSFTFLSDETEERREDVAALLNVDRTSLYWVLAQ